MYILIFIRIIIKTLTVKWVVYTLSETDCFWSLKTMYNYIMMLLSTTVGLELQDKFSYENIFWFTFKINEFPYILFFDLYIYLKSIIFVCHYFLLKQVVSTFNIKFCTTKINLVDNYGKKLNVWYLCLKITQKRLKIIKNVIIYRQF